MVEMVPKEANPHVNGDNLKRRSIRELNKVEKFLGVPYFFKSDMISFNKSTTHYYFKTCENSTERYTDASVGTRHVFEKLPPDNLLKAISAFLQPHAREFCRVASVKFSWYFDIYEMQKQNSITSIPKLLFPKYYNYCSL